MSATADSIAAESSGTAVSAALESSAVSGGREVAGG
jgi:hypothetical protein